MVISSIIKNMEFLRKYSPLFTCGILAIAIVALIIGQFRDVRTEIKEVRTELKADIAQVRGEVKEVRTELKADIAQVRGEVKEVRTELKADIAQVRMELTARMDRTDAKIDQLGDKMDSLIVSLSNRKPAAKAQ